MAKPDFPKGTIETLAKRAGYLCSNPECRVQTVGPNADAERATTIGQAAHIFGARSGSARFDPGMTDAARSQSTNGIWLCGNCHTQIDRDSDRYSAQILFRWREIHEAYVAERLGSAAERVQFEERTSEVNRYGDLPPHIRRIVFDKPPGWEWRLTAEYMRHLNTPIFQAMDDLQDGVVARKLHHVPDHEVIDWAHRSLTEIRTLISPIQPLFERLNRSWGTPYQAASVMEIERTVRLLSEAIKSAQEFEERIYFSVLREEFQPIKHLMQNCLGSQIAKLRELPDHLDRVVDLLLEGHGGTPADPTVISHTIEFNLPDGWSTKFTKELRRTERILNGQSDYGCSSIIILISLFVIVLILLMILIT